MFIINSLTKKLIKSLYRSGVEVGNNGSKKGERLKYIKYIIQ